MHSLKPIYTEAGFPVFQNKMYASREAAVGCPKGDIEIRQDASTGLIRNAAFDPTLVDYSADYQNEQGVSDAFQRHLLEARDIVSRHLDSRPIIEVGCGKGLFMQMLRDAGHSVTGVDPTYEGDDPSIIKEYFSDKLNLSRNGVVLRHVLEHIPDPVAFLKHVRDVNGGGLVYIEVPSVDWIKANNAWFDVFYEHVNYFRLTDFKRMFGNILEAGAFFGGQYIFVVADLATLQDPQREPSDVYEFNADFLGTVSEFASVLRASRQQPAEQIAVWGGASKGVIFSLLMQRRGLEPTFAIDLNPAKQGKFMAASGLEILSPEAANARLPDGATVFVMNNNYLPEIKTMSGNRLNYISVTQ